MPWTRTRTYAHAFATPDTKLGGQYNYLSYTMFDTVFWRAIAGQMNRWRKLTLDLPPTSLDKLDQGKVPFLYNLSPSLMPPRELLNSACWVSDDAIALDWPEWVHVTGYWFLDNDQKQTGWTPPAALTDFIASARKENKKLVYIGFGSIVVADPEGLTKTVQAAVQSAGVAAIVSKGWSSRLTTAGASDDEKAVFERQQEKERDLLRSSGSIYTVDSMLVLFWLPRLS
jgi:sterol 3beta-glucosyltransferase